MPNRFAPKAGSGSKAGAREAGAHDTGSSREGASAAGETPSPAIAAAGLVSPQALAPSMQGLVQMAQKDNIDVRPTLIRVITDLYVMNQAPDAEEVARYTELAIAMLPRADASVRAIVAGKLARHGATPPRVAAKLARDVIAVAQPILMRSEALDDLTLADIVRRTTPAHALAVCGRDEVGPETAMALLTHEDDGVRNVARRYQTLPAGEIPAPTEAARPAAPADTPAFTEAPQRQSGSESTANAFLDASADAEFLYRDRSAVTPEELASHARALLASMPDARAPLIAQTTAIRLASSGLKSPTGIASDLMRAAFDAAAMARSPSEVAALFVRIGTLPRETANTIVADGGGELLAIACRAARLPRVLTQRILMFVNPLVGLSVERHYAAMDVFTSIDPKVADAIVASWRGGQRIGQHVPHADDAPGVRRSFGRAQRPASDRAQTDLTAKGRS